MPVKVNKPAGTQNSKDERKIIFLSGIRSDETFGRRLLQNHKEIGLSFEDYILHTKSKGENSYNAHNEFLRKPLLDINKQLRNEKLSINELADIKVIICEKTIELTNILNATIDPLPDASAFVTSIRVEEPDGSSYIINEGLNEKIADRYKITITSLKQALAIVESRIEKMERNGIKEMAKESTVNDTVSSRIEITNDGIIAFNKCFSNFLIGDLFSKSRSNKVTFKKPATLLGRGFSLLFTKSHITGHDADTLSQFIFDNVTFLDGSKKEKKITLTTIRDCFGRNSVTTQKQKIGLKPIICLNNLTYVTTKKAK